MVDREPHSDAGATQSKRKNTEDSNAEEDEDPTCVAGRIPSVQELEELLHSAPSSCHHGDEVWSNLFLGDMCVTHLVFKLLYMSRRLLSTLNSIICICQVYVS